MRKFLYSPGYGSGWSTWSSASREAQIFMMTYKPFIEFLSENKFTENPKYRYSGIKDIDERFPLKEEAKLIKQFLKDFLEKFPNEPEPYLGGLKQLKIREIEEYRPFRIREYDGSESVEYLGDEDSWIILPPEED